MVDRYELGSTILEGAKKIKQRKPRTMSRYVKDIPFHVVQLRLKHPLFLEAKEAALEEGHGAVSTLAMRLLINYLSDLNSRIAK